MFPWAESRVSMFRKDGKKMKRRVKGAVALLLTGAMAVSCLAGCGGNKQGDKKGTSTTDVEIAYWNSGLGTGWLDDVIEGFKTVHPEYNVYYTATADAAAIGSALGMEDVDSVDLYLGLTSTKTQYLEPLDDVLDATADGETKSIREKINPGYLALMQDAEGKVHNLTYGGGVISFVYSKKMFQEAGITQLPRTTDELAVVCDALRKKDMVPLCHFIDGGYYEFVNEAFYMQYEGQDYYLNNFYACKDDNGVSPSKEVFKKQDGRYNILKAYEKFITPENVLQGSNSGSHVNMQTMFVNGECAMMASGSWMANEMKGNGNLEDFDMMRLPVLSSITDKLDTVKKESDLRKLISAIDSVLDGEKTAADYQSGDGYQVEDTVISAADWDYVYAARTTLAINFSGESAYIPNYSNAKEGAKEFLKYLYSDEGYKVYSGDSHLILPVSLCEGSLDMSDWSDFEKSQYQYLMEGTRYASSYNMSKHAIFTDGGASLFAGINFINHFCTKNEADRYSADEAWEKIQKEVDAKYESTWLANIK